MSNATPKLRLFAALAALFLLAVSGGCKGFFVNQPNSVTVTTNTGASSFSAAPTASLKAVASFDSGDKDVTNSASWQSSSGCATVSATGVVTATGTASSVTISATVAAVSGSITGSTTVSGGTAQTLTVTAPLSIVATSTGQFAAALNGSDVTASSTWTSDNTSAVLFSTSTPGFATFGASGQTANVTASLNQGSSCATGTLLVTIP